MTPLVSICIPTYNGEVFIAEAMDSAILQTYTNLEIIISDDSSKDATVPIIESYISKTRIPIHIHYHKPEGIGANWNYCVQQAKGDYIKFLFQDDVLEPTCIKVMMALAIKNPKVGLVYCKRHIITEGPPEKFNDFIINYSNLQIYWNSFEVTEGILLGKYYLKDRQLLNSPKNKIGEPTAVLLKKDCFETVGWFNTHLKQALDHEFWYRIMKFYSIGFVEDYLVSFRLHDKQASTINKNGTIPDKELLYKCYYTHLFWYLHPVNQFKLLKLYHPVFKVLLRIKHLLYGK